VDGVHLQRIVAATLYIPRVTGYPHSQEILDLKTKGAFASEYAGVLIHVLGTELPDFRPTSVVPIPSAELQGSREGVRKIALLLAAHYHAPVREVLKYARVVKKQRGLDRAEREKNLKGALIATRRVPGGTALLVDDVTTTGYTVAEATRALRAAGADSTVAAVVGRDIRLDALAAVGALKPVEG
jgi:predicted amidophosphoribosyltransferase